jgi:hypothetical protein
MRLAGGRGANGANVVGILGPPSYSIHCEGTAAAQAAGPLELDGSDSRALAGAWVLRMPDLWKYQGLGASGRVPRMLVPLIARDFPYLPHATGPGFPCRLGDGEATSRAGAVRTQCWVGPWKLNDVLYLWISMHGTQLHCSSCGLLHFSASP